MNITKRLYTYPVLSEETTDYQDKEFSVNISYNPRSISELEFTVSYTLTSDSIMQLIRDKEANFMIHAECTDTSYRQAFTSYLSNQSFVIPIDRINGTLELVAFVVMRNSKKQFWSDEWCEDFEGLKFDFEKGTIIAYQNLDNISITKDYEEFTDSSSIISITKKFSDHSIPSEVNLDGHRIKIQLYEKDYNTYAKIVKNNPEMKQILNNLIVLPALVYMFDELQVDDGIERYSTRNWFISLEKAYENRGIDFKEKILSDDTNGFILAQEVMELPIAKSISGIDDLLNNLEPMEAEE